MRRILVCALVLSLFHIAKGQSERKSELFTSYFPVTTPISQVYIPTQTCHTIISQADRIVAAPNGLRSVSKPDLENASLNLRACATLGLARAERDLAVGLYGEVVSETERRSEVETESVQNS